MVSSINFSNKAFSNLDKLITEYKDVTGKAISKSAYVSQLIEEKYDADHNGFQQLPKQEKEAEGNKDDNSGY